MGRRIRARCQPFIGRRRPDQDRPYRANDELRGDADLASFLHGDFHDRQGASGRHRRSGRPGAQPGRSVP